MLSELPKSPIHWEGLKEGLGSAERPLFTKLRVLRETFVKTARGFVEIRRAHTRRAD